ncbi:MAG: hypothetical protein L3J62_00130 [Gammaproteobacteria bacterium]|nr:hypothetical protein [Gammaproteobacteria bacterium]MCF6229188.1 hypothetical protein [Gammaproteobacteria bacterium]
MPCQSSSPTTHSAAATTTNTTDSTTCSAGTAHGGVVDREGCVHLPNGASALFSAAVDMATLAVVLNVTTDLR